MISSFIIECVFPIQLPVVCLLNFKWTFDLLRGKYKAIRYGKSAKIEKGL